MLEQVCQLARNAGDAIMEVYDGNQPINVASRKMILRSRRRISQRIKSLSAACRRWIREYPILSEDRSAVREVRQHWQRYWLKSDPLDGTKEFIMRNGEFTVNIALI